MPNPPAPPTPLPPSRMSTVQWDFADDSSSSSSSSVYLDRSDDSDDSDEDGGEREDDGRFRPVIASPARQRRMSKTRVDYVAPDSSGAGGGGNDDDDDDPSSQLHRRHHRDRGPTREDGYEVYGTRWIMLGYVSILNLMSDWTCYSVAPIARMTIDKYGGGSIPRSS